MTNNNSSIYFTLQAKATELAQEAEFNRLMAEALWEQGTKEGVRYDVAGDLQMQADQWDRKSRDAADKLEGLIRATKSSFGFTLHP